MDNLGLIAFETLGNCVVLLNVISEFVHNAFSLTFCGLAFVRDFGALHCQPALKLKRGRMFN